MRNFWVCGFLLLMAAALNACGQHRAVIPMPAPSPTETDVNTTVAIHHPKSAQRPKDSPSCQPARWRQAANRSFRERERWSFGVRWGAIRAGEALLAVEGVEPVRGRPAYH